MTDPLPDCLVRAASTGFRHVDATSEVPIPEWLAGMPTIGGLVVPWVTPRTVDCRYLFGSVDGSRVERALSCRWCGVCGRPLDDRLVLLMRLSDLARQCTNEPALHPQCAGYTIAACPMVAGRLQHYRSTPTKLDSTMVPGPDSAARQGTPAEPWFAVWLAGYRVATDHGNLVASYAHTQPLRIRPITWPARSVRTVGRQLRRRQPTVSGRLGRRLNRTSEVSDSAPASVIRHEDRSIAAYRPRFSRSSHRVRHLSRHPSCSVGNRGVHDIPVSSLSSNHERRVVIARKMQVLDRRSS